MTSATSSIPSLGKEYDPSGYIDHWLSQQVEIQEGAEIPRVLLSTKHETDKPGVYEVKYFWTNELFQQHKNIVVFSIVAADTPVCSNTELPLWAKHIDEIRKMFDLVVCMMPDSRDVALEFLKRHNLYGKVVPFSDCNGLLALKMGIGQNLSIGLDPVKDAEKPRQLPGICPKRTVMAFEQRDVKDADKTVQKVVLTSIQIDANGKCEKTDPTKFLAHLKQMRDLTPGVAQLAIAGAPAEKLERKA